MQKSKIEVSIVDETVMILKTKSNYHSLQYILSLINLAIVEHEVSFSTGTKSFIDNISETCYFREEPHLFNLNVKL